ncbi:hypothetical protein GAPWKB11_0202 [Gilliamella apicola]|nr:hypothetical protein GAPWKB11_0202 [Gilliamella apicola]
MIKWQAKQLITHKNHVIYKNARKNDYQHHCSKELQNDKCYSLDF